jgi:effector-binding domain-containing protein
MAYDVTVRHLERTPTLTIRSEGPMSSIKDRIGEGFGALFAYLGPRAGQTTGVFARYYTMSETNAVMDTGVMLAAPVAGEGNITAGEIAEGDAAVTTHVGPYETVAAAYEAVQAWIAANHRTVAGAPLEVYLTDPETEPDPAKWRTEVIFPIA